MLRRRLFLGLAPTLLLGCVAPPARHVLAPTGELRVGVYRGSPTSLVRDMQGNAAGLSVELGQAFAGRLGVPYRQLEFPRLALVLDALKAGEVDFTVTNATAMRARDMLFSPPVVALELGLLVAAGSPIASIGDMDRPGHSIGVAQGSSSQGTLGARLRQAMLVATPTLQDAAQQLRAGTLQAFATNKAILYELADAVPGARVLEGRWGIEQLAIAIPKGREEQMTDVREFTREAVASGLVERAARRAGLRGTAAVGDEA